MKSLCKHIYENNFHKSEINKKLIINQQVDEKLLINKDYKNNDYFIYELYETEQIKIFDRGWTQFNKYKNKVYIDGKKLAIDFNGWTIEKFEPGIYEVEIKDIDKVTYCNFMFFACKELVKVPWFDTSNIDDMNSMFLGL